jgi:uncharacterized membrane protein
MANHSLSRIFLIVTGVALIIAQIVIPSHFREMENVSGVRNIRLKATVVGFGVILLGFLLRLAKAGIVDFGR